MPDTFLDYLPSEHVPSAFDLYLDSLQDKLVPLLGNSAESREFLLSCLDTGHCLCAMHDGKVVGILAVQDSSGSFLNPTLKGMIRTYGILGGLFRLAGLALLQHKVSKDEFYLDGVAVSDTMRGQGVGTKLLEILEESAKTNGISKITLDVIDTNPRAKALYERHGYQEIAHTPLGVFQKIFGFSFSSVTTMEKSL